MFAIELLVACTYWVYTYFGLGGYAYLFIPLPPQFDWFITSNVMLLFFISFHSSYLSWTFFIPYVAGWRIEV